MVYFIDWNDYGIDARPFSSIVYGTPEDWFGSHGWHVEGTSNVEDWSSLTEAYYRLLVKNSDSNIPKIIYGKGIKGRGYHKVDYESHGSPHKRNSELFWKTKEDFANKYDVEFESFGEKPAGTREAQEHQARSYFNSVFSVMRSQPDLVEYLSSTLLELGESVPEKIDSCRITKANPAKDKKIFDVGSLPNSLFVEPGEKAPNRVGLSKYASYINSISTEKYGRPLVIAMSADLADSTNISGFAKGFNGSKDLGLLQP